MYGADPLAQKQIKTAGYNQSLCFAKGLGTGVAKIDFASLKESRHGHPNTKKKYQRWENVEGIFTLPSPSNLAHKHVLLVDDVDTTTGAYHRSCLDGLATGRRDSIVGAELGFCGQGVCLIR